jgi:macrolide-specific efflux system membrane fusion protein
MKKKSASSFARARAGIAAHKTLVAVIAITLIVGGYEIYHAKANETSNVPQYTLTPAHIGTLKQTVSGTGQVSASNQTDIQSQVSGTIESINVSVGQAVTKGQLIATIDPTNALNSLQSAKISLAKLTQPAKTTDLSNAQNSLLSSYNSAYNTVSSAYLDLPAISAGMKDLLYGQTGFLSDQKKTYLSPTARTYRDAAGDAYDKAVAQYAISFGEYKGLDRSSPTSTLLQMYADTYTTMKMMSDAAAKAQAAITYITTYSPDYDTKDASAAATDINGWTSQANSDTASILSAQTSITSAQNSIVNLTAAPDSLDLSPPRHLWIRHSAPMPSISSVRRMTASSAASP